MYLPREPKRPRGLKEDQLVFLDYRGRQYTLEGGIGATNFRGTMARVWIWAHNIDGQRLMTRSARFDLKTAKEFRTALDQAIAEAEVGEAQWNAVMAELPPVD
jgi:hypothetical protein